MKPSEMKPETVYRIINKETNEIEGSYSRACCDEYDFSSIFQARSANVHDIYKNKARYKIAKYRVTYELIDEDVDPANKVEIEKYEHNKRIESEMDELGIIGFDRIGYKLVNQ